MAQNHPHGHDHDHHDHHDHGHGHGHDHGPVDMTLAFAVGAGLNLAFVVAEAATGVFTHSLALVADAAHNLSDVLGLVMAGVAAWLARSAPSHRRTYGLRKGTILAALANAVLLLTAVGAVAWEAVRRFADPQPVDAWPVMAVAALGVLINTGTALMFMARRKSDINVRGAFMHMAADAVVSVGVVVAALAIQLTGWLWLDPVVSLVIVAVIVIGTWSLLRDSLDLALDAAPRNIDPVAVRSYLSGLSGVAEVHDLHIWAMSTTETALTAHLIRPQADNPDGFLHEVQAALAERFGIGHATLQLETGGEEACRLAPANVV